MGLAKVIGVGRTKFGVLPEVQFPELIEEASIKALSDAEADLSKINRVFFSNFLGGILQNQLHANSLFSSIFPEFRKEAVRIEAACASGGVSLATAISALKQGERALVVGAEKMTGFDGRKVAYAINSASDSLEDQKEGLIFPASYAIVCQQHMLRYKTTLRELSLISLKNHENAQKNPLAHFFHKKVSLSEIESSPIVASPLRLFDCSPMSDGAAAVIIEKSPAKRGDVEIIGSAVSTDTLSLTGRESLVSFRSAKEAARRAYSQSKVSPSKIGAFEVHDCFTIAEILAMEDLGISKPSETRKLIERGETKIGGKFPINTDGGLKADGHAIGATGLAQVCEIVSQLRGDAGKRQIDGVKFGLTHNVGGVGGTCAVHILARK